MHWEIILDEEEILDELAFISVHILFQSVLLPSHDQALITPTIML